MIETQSLRKLIFAIDRAHHVFHGRVQQFREFHEGRNRVVQSAPSRRRSPRRDQVRAIMYSRAPLLRFLGREAELLASWEQRRRESQSKEEGSVGMSTSQPSDVGDHVVKSSISASVWKVTCGPGDVVQSPDDVLVILEAMKTEVNVVAGEDNVGRKVRSLAGGLKQGSLVHAGDVLVIFE